MAAELHKKRWLDGGEYWVDENRIVQGPVVSGKPREDSKEYSERHTVEKMLGAWEWPPHLTSIERPDTGTYEFDCQRSDTKERVAVEVKRITLPEGAMREAASKNTIEFSTMDFYEIPARLVAKANKQLAGAPEGSRRCVLLAWDYDLSEGDPWWDVLLVPAPRRIAFHDHENVDEVWLTTSALRRFIRLEFE